MGYLSRLFPMPPIVVLAIPSVLAACSSINANQRALDMFDPQVSALYRYDRSAATYRTCISDNPSYPTACEWKRNIMEADQRLLYASLPDR